MKPALAKNNFNGSIHTKSAALLFFATWWFVWLVFQITLLQSAGIPAVKALADAAVSNILLAAFCLLVFNNLRYYLPKKEKYLYVLLMGSALGGIWLLLVKLILKALYQKDTAYIQLLQQTSSIRFAAAFLMIICFTAIGILWFSQKEQQEENERRIAMEQLANEAELNKLRQQLQPHFLFNSLNSISALTGQQPEKARHMIQQLSDFLRGTIRNESRQWVSLQEELDYLQLYLDIEKVRFGQRLQTKITCDETAKTFKIPSLLLQPLVENSIKFGLYDTVSEVEILIAAKSNNDMLEVTVQNPYDAATSGSSKGTGFGLASIKRRLFLLYGRQDLLQIKKEAATFITIVSIPQKA